MTRVGLYRPVDVKTLRSQKLRMLPTHRKLLQSKAIAVENNLRGTLRNFGLKVGMVGKVRFASKSLSRISPTWRYRSGSRVICVASQIQSASVVHGYYRAGIAGS